MTVESQKGDKNLTGYSTGQIPHSARLELETQIKNPFSFCLQQTLLVVSTPSGRLD